MEFDKSRIYSAVNADELKPGDKVIVADTLKDLRSVVDAALWVYELADVLTESSEDRFFVNEKCYLLAYLVERAENCTNCAGRITCVRQKTEHPELTKCCNYKRYECSEYKPKTEKIAENCIDCIHLCKSISPCLRYNPKTEQKAEKHYRPFRDTDELIKVWMDGGKYDYKEMPLIWVRRKGDNSNKGSLITSYGKTTCIIAEVNLIGADMSRLFTDFEFLDGSPCGVEE